MRKELEARVVKVGKEGNVLWIAVGKESPVYLAVVYVSSVQNRGKTEEYCK